MIPAYDPTPRLPAAIIVFVAVLAATAIVVSSVGTDPLAQPGSKGQSGCLGRTPNVRGTPDDDVIFGSTRNDVVTTGRGADIVFGLGGNDLICTGRGGDRIDAGDGVDRVNGGRGSDVCSAEKRRGCEG